MSKQAHTSILIILHLALSAWSLGVTASADGPCPPGWSGLAGGIPIGFSQVSTMTVFDDGAGPALYAGGGSLGTPRGFLFKWDGQTWTQVPGNFEQWVSALAVYDDGSGPALYASGRAGIGGVLEHGIAKWNGSEWSTVGGGVRGFVQRRRRDALVTSLIVFDDGSGPVLFVGGIFETAGAVAVNSIAKWDGSEWSAIGGGLEQDNGTFDVPYVRAILFFDGGNGAAMIVGGWFSEAGGSPVQNIAKWDGVRWSALGGGLPIGRVLPAVMALGIFDEGNGAHLFAGGSFANPREEIARWTGSAWEAVGGGVSGGITYGSALRTFDDGRGEQLYFGGLFSQAGNRLASRIARWNGLEWQPLGRGVQDGWEGTKVLAFEEFDDGIGPSLFVGGDFAVAGTVRTNAIARWGCIRGDLNCDGRLDGADIDPFFLALGDPQAYSKRFPECNILLGDFNRDGALNGAEIDGFFRSLGGFR